jgi:hypothetical protein
MMHWSYAKNDFPFDVNRTRRHAPYPTFAAFDNDLQNPQNPAGAGAFWADVARNPHVLNHMIKNRQRMQDKFNEKNRHPGGAQITPGWVGQVFVLFISAPNQADSQDHAYIFFKTADNELDYQINKTFG